MFTALILAVVMQTPPKLTPRPPAAPKPPPATAEEMRAQRFAEAKALIAKRKIAALKKAASRSAKADAEYREAVAQQAYLDRMGPIWAAEARENARVAATVQTANAMTSMADASQKRAAIAATAVKIQARQAGYPQVGLQQYVP